MRFVQLDTIHDTYEQVLADIILDPEYTSAPRGLPIREIRDYAFTVNYPKCEPIITFDRDRNKVIAEYTQKELALYISGSREVSDFAKVSKFWEKIANPDGTVNSAYGYLLWVDRSTHNFTTPWEWAKESLLSDKDTRQAIIYFNQPKHAWLGNKDFPCTLTGTFQIRNDELHLTIVMRSQDVVLGLVYDLPFFVFLLEKMREDVRHKYPDLKVGTYTHVAHSMHLYEKDLDKALKMIGSTPEVKNGGEARV